MFQEWALNNGWNEGLSIERIDVNGGYNPENCTFIPKLDQWKNRRNTVTVIGGVKKSSVEWASLIGINTLRFRQRLKKNPSIKELIKPSVTRNSPQSPDLANVQFLSNEIEYYVPNKGVVKYTDETFKV